MRHALEGLLFTIGIVMSLMPVVIWAKRYQREPDQMCITSGYTFMLLFMNFVIPTLSMMLITVQDLFSSILAVSVIDMIMLYVFIVQLYVIRRLKPKDHCHESTERDRRHAHILSETLYYQLAYFAVVTGWHAWESLEQLTKSF